jgi:hypothetical protein
MRDDVSDQLELINGKDSSGKDQLEQDLIETVRSLSNGDPSTIHKFLEVLIGWKNTLVWLTKKKKFLFAPEGMINQL